MKIIMASSNQEKRLYFSQLYRDPVKHFVRVHGWLSAAIEKTLDIRSEKRRGKSRFAKYFTFPGEHAIDVLLFSERGIIEETKVGFPGVVYCESRFETLTEINKRLGKCMGVFPYPFERAVFSRQFESFCPFDIINLDLTREIFPRNGRPESNTIRAIQKLLSLHSNQDFDLYITFKSSRRETNPEAVKDFMQMVNDNFASNTSLKDAFVESCGMECDELQHSNFTLFWCKSFPKWVLEQGLTKDVGGKLVGEYFYARRPRYATQYDIITFLFSFQRSSSHFMSTHRMITDTQREILRSFSLTPMNVDEILGTNVEAQVSLRKDVERILKKPPKRAS